MAKSKKRGGKSVRSSLPRADARSSDAVPNIQKVETGQGRVNIYLRESFNHSWALYAEKGHQLSPTFRGDLMHVIDQAKAWASTWPSWNIVIEDKNERN